MLLDLIQRLEAFDGIDDRRGGCNPAAGLCLLMGLNDVDFEEGRRFIGATLCHLPQCLVGSVRRFGVPPDGSRTTDRGRLNMEAGVPSQLLLSQQASCGRFFCKA